MINLSSVFKELTSKSLYFLPLYLWFYGYFVLKEFKFSFLSIYKQILGLIVILSITFFISGYIIPPISSFFIKDILGALLIPNFAFLGSITEQISIIFDSGVKILIFIASYSCYLSLFRILCKEDIDRIEKLNLSIPFKGKIYKLVKKVLFSEKKK